MYYKINSELCNGCGYCKSVCLLYGNDKNTVDPQLEGCSGCGHCFSICQSNAIEPIRKLEQPLDERENTITKEELISFLASRRSHRNFETQGVSQALLEQIISEARYVPSGANCHAYEFTVVQTEDIKKKISGQVVKVFEKRYKLLRSAVLRHMLMPFVDAQTRTYLKDGSYYKKISYMLSRAHKGEDMVFYGAPVVLFVHSKQTGPTPKEDAVLAAYSINLLTETYGLGACFLTSVQYAAETKIQCKRIIGLSKKDNIHAVLCIGYPAKEYGRAAFRQVKKAKFI